MHKVISAQVDMLSLTRLLPPAPRNRVRCGRPLPPEVDRTRSAVDARSTTIRYAAGVSGMVAAWRCLTDSQLVDVNREVDPRRSALKGGHAVQLRGRHPEVAGGINPHRVDPQQARILDESRDFPVRRYLDHPQPVSVTDVDVPGGVDR